MGVTTSRAITVRRLPIGMDSAAHPCGRRRFLCTAMATVVVAGCSAGSPGAFGDVAAGNAGSLTVGDVKLVPSVSACIARDMLGIYAMTLMCTHQGCDMSTDGSVSPERILCGCHGSEFNVDGAVVRGPATAPLEHFSVTADSHGNLTVHGGMVVDASVRLSV